MEGKKETENLIYETDEYKLMKDWEFNEGDIQTLYCMAIVKQRDLLCIRDLTAEHLGMLKSIREGSLAAIEKKYGVKSANIRAFFHYLPTYFHLHVHFVHAHMTMKVSC